MHANKRPYLSMRGYISTLSYYHNQLRNMSPNQCYGSVVKRRYVLCILQHFILLLTYWGQDPLNPINKNSALVRVAAWCGNVQALLWIWNCNVRDEDHGNKLLGFKQAKTKLSAIFAGIWRQRGFVCREALLFGPTHRCPIHQVPHRPLEQAPQHAGGNHWMSR